MRRSGDSRSEQSSRHHINPVHHIHNERRHHHVHHVKYKQRRAFYAPELIPECLDNPLKVDNGFDDAGVDTAQEKACQLGN